MYCIALHYAVIYYIVLYYIALFCIHCIVNAYIYAEIGVYDVVRISEKQTHREQMEPAKRKGIDVPKSSHKVQEVETRGRQLCVITIEQPRISKSSTNI